MENKEENINKIDFMTVKELEKKICIPAWTIRRLAREKKLPSYKITGSYLFDYNEVIKTIKKFKVS